MHSTSQRTVTVNRSWKISRVEPPKGCSPCVHDDATGVHRRFLEGPSTRVHTIPHTLAVDVYVNR